MKKINRYCVVLIILCLAVFFGYRIWDTLRTDTNPPEISISEEQLQLSVWDPQEKLLEGVSAADREDGDVTGSLVVERVKLTDSEGSIQITYAAFDASGNVAKKTRSARYTDYQSPTFSLSEPLAFSSASSFEVLDVIRAEDVVEGDISQRIRTTSLDKDAITSQGVHDVEFKVTNSLGDTVKLVLPVEVYPAGVYNAGLTLSSYLVYVPRNVGFSARNYLESFTYGATTISVKNGLPERLSLKITGEVDTRTPGVYSVSYTVSDGTFTGYTRLIVIVEG